MRVYLDFKERASKEDGEEEDDSDEVGAHVGETGGIIEISERIYKA